MCLLFSLLLFSPVGRSRGAAHVVSSGLHYAGLTAGSLINGWSQRGQTQELRGSCTQQAAPPIQQLEVSGFIY